MLQVFFHIFLFCQIVVVNLYLNLSVQQPTQCDPVKQLSVNSINMRNGFTRHDKKQQVIKSVGTIVKNIDSVTFLSHENDIANLSHYFGYLDNETSGKLSETGSRRSKFKKLSPCKEQLSR